MTERSTYPTTEIVEKKIEIPMRCGYSSAQHEVDLQNIRYAEYVLENPFASRALSIRIATENIKEEQLEKFLEWIRTIYNPRLIYYPFSGWHITPREVFGEDKVVHFSNDDNNPFLKDIGTGLRVKGDASSQPFKSSIFDAIFLRRHDLGKKDLPRSFLEFRRVVKEGGLFIVEKDRQKNIAQYCKDNLQVITLPLELGSSTKDSFALFLNRDKERKRRFLWWKQN